MSTVSNYTYSNMLCFEILSNKSNFDNPGDLGDVASRLQRETWLMFVRIESEEKVGVQPSGAFAHGPARGPG